MADATILFNEGALHSVLITISSGVTVTGYNATILVKDDFEDTAILEFSTIDSTLIYGSNNTILWNIPANKSVGLGGSYLWQLKLYTDNTDAILFPVNRMIITESINN